MDDLNGGSLFKNSSCSNRLSVVSHQLNAFTDKRSPKTDNRLLLKEERVNRRKMVVTAGTILIAFLLASCGSVGPGGSGFTTYRDGLFNGEQYLRNGQNQLAIGEFLQANQGDPTQPMPMALAGQAAYNMGDFAKASQYLAQSLAIRSDSNAYVIVKAYQALIALKEKRQQDGIAALGDYLRAYRVSYPEYTFSDVERMYTLAVETGDINVADLEPVITDQVNRYEKELFEFF
jgi:tetratricopeptide (TPR) repeat protein